MAGFLTPRDARYGLDGPMCHTPMRIWRPWPCPYDDPMHQADPKPYWNTNVARHPGILRAVPEGCGEALDVGCGDGLLARKLAERVKRVVGIDKSPEMIACARDLAAGYPEVTFGEGDFLTAHLPVDGYDFICSVTTIHHMDWLRSWRRYGRRHPVGHPCAPPCAR